MREHKTIISNLNTPVEAEGDALIPVLVAISGPLFGRVSLIEDHTYRIGRSDGGNLVLADDAVSREHAVIVKKDDQFLLKDLHSTNGTYVNFNRIQEAVLLENDKISIGHSHFSIYIQRIFRCELS